MTAPAVPTTPNQADYVAVYTDIVSLLEAARHVAARSVNALMGLILCASKGSNEAHYALEGLPNKVLAAEYQTVLPDEKLLAEELDKTRRELEARRIARGGDAEGGE